ncbi:D-alanyl-D-alanine-carboxypeptidase/D-alanyl-D-alanine-endopeptidase [Yokenella regensburgei]|uniref:D-alanyl-D-alanine-carboxypeptidase/D-alanyl-D-alanine-endopeptidase n=1 Tax=Yokenella regensburgei TaxID=158877 RepID=A0ABX9S094_9ENTR|nr:serine hydrolase domain-containing protein [Yokenella regensburgei]RKR64074.1 D-alanyl-D-alanine-carboxypeptidase/D-alanyl-D-alanine-endopeptidase [Yokenella regensburgei]VFS25858.1 beta-lactamase/D-alanine carboxypeptidase [Yokenella regensburgei]
MQAFIPPTTEVLDNIVNSFPLIAQPPADANIAIAIGWVLDNGDQGVYLSGSLQDEAGNGMVLNDSVLFKLASSSKLFTAMAFAYACLDSASPVTRESVLGDFILFSDSEVGSALKKIPLYNLAAYTSGLPADNNSSAGTLPPLNIDESYSVQDMLNFLNQDASFPVEPYGEISTYSNLGFSLLAVAISRACGTNGFNIWLQDYLFRNENVNMADSRYCPIPGNPWPARFPCGFVYDEATQKYTKASLYSPKFGAYYGGGGVMSSARDMLTFLKINMGLLKPFPFSEELIQWMQTPIWTQSGTITGLGWFFSPDESVLTKNGILDGTNTAIQMAASTSPGRTPSAAGVFVLTNLSEINMPAGKGDLATKIAGQVYLTMQKG